MITNKEYFNKPESFWMDKKVRTLKDMRNGWFEIPKGTILKITRKYQGFSLEGIEVCPHCKIGKRLSISRVEGINLELLEDQDE